jgi:YegS/Rv2252/BmrU family lipid kinase
MQPKKVSLIYNPTAGTVRKDPRQIERLIKSLSEQGIEIDPLATECSEHACELAAKSVGVGAEVVIVCGGDGTINEAAQSLVGTETALAVWPGGTANVLAHELGLSRNARTLARMINENQIRTISVGRAVKPEQNWERYFLLMAGIGLDATIVHGVNLQLKKKAGVGAYFASGLNYLAQLPLTPFSVDFNGKHYDSTFTVIANAANYAKWFTLAPDAKLDDDKFDICLFNSQSRLAYLGYALLSLTGSHTMSPGVVYQHAGEVKANSNDAALVQLDGEVVGHLPMKFEIVPHSLRVVAPVK